jgi:L,D-transpeptidase YcbB
VRAAVRLLAVALGLLGLPGAAHAALDAAIGGAFAASAEGPVQRAVRVAWADRADAARYVEPAPPHRPTPLARETVALLTQAATWGLSADDYRASALAAVLDAPRDEAGAAAFEVALAFGFGRFLADLGFGRIDPVSLGHDLPQQRRRAVLPEVLRSALSADTAGAAVTAVEPRLRLHRSLLQVLAEQRRLAALPPPPPLPAAGTRAASVTPGDAWPGVDALADRLLRQGDLDPQAVRPATGRYEGALVAAVQAFQSRHGLDADGVIGAQTRAALEVPAARRVRQVEVSLERLRWIGDTPPAPFVAVNIPEFRLWAVRGDGSPPLSMGVVVGRTVTGTPVFVDAIEAVELNPYWNVPPSIASGELYPKLARDPGYLASQQMELLGGAGLSGEPLRRALAGGSARIRQRPGTLNALGKLKFVMPNAHNVYLHDTPARALFDRGRRDFSHGCVRLQHPFDLAEFVLADSLGWSAEQLAESAAPGERRVLRLRTPIPVLVMYSTVNVSTDGRARFFPDIYRLDARLEAALDAR